MSLFWCIHQSCILCKRYRIRDGVCLKYTPATQWDKSQPSIQSALILSSFSINVRLSKEDSIQLSMAQSAGTRTDRVPNWVAVDVRRYIIHHTVARPLAKDLWMDITRCNPLYCTDPSAGNSANPLVRYSAEELRVNLCTLWFIYQLTNRIYGALRFDIDAALRVIMSALSNVVM